MMAMSMDTAAVLARCAIRVVSFLRIAWRLDDSLGMHNLDSLGECAFRTACCGIGHGRKSQQRQPKGNKRRSASRDQTAKHRAALLTYRLHYVTPMQ